MRLRSEDMRDSSLSGRNPQSESGSGLGLAKAV